MKIFRVVTNFNKRNARVLSLLHNWIWIGYDFFVTCKFWDFLERSLFVWLGSIIFDDVIKTSKYIPQNGIFFGSDNFCMSTSSPRIQITEQKILHEWKNNKSWSSVKNVFKGFGPYHPQGASSRLGKQSDFHNFCRKWSVSLFSPFLFSWSSKMHQIVGRTSSLRGKSALKNYLRILFVVYIISVPKFFMWLKFRVNWTLFLEVRR